ncbi:multidrug resistance protein [Colletotrichum higginsianum]|uniref:Multidrug resistance protein n=1 Tax=Colletotrichum higginsianum (strain IMI 349063) TaxID=759273 RepID=H1VLV7_COLHI|nr:multidrug resistance protein [Colletotrichum higginsianum]
MRKSHYSVSHRKPSWKRLFAFSKLHHLPTLVAGIFATCMCADLRTAFAVVIGQMFQIISNYGSEVSGSSDTITQASQLSITICCLGAGILVGNAVVLSSWVVFGELQAKSARTSVFSRLLAHEMSWYDMRTDGIPGLLARTEANVPGLWVPCGRHCYLDCITRPGLECHLEVDTRTRCSVPFAAVALSLTSRGLHPAIMQQKAHLADASKLVHACVTGIDLVKVFNGFSQEMRTYSKFTDGSMELHLLQARCNSIQMSVTGFWVSAMFAGGFWFGLWLVTKGENASAILISFYATLTALEAIYNVLPQCSSFHFPAGETRFVLGSSGSGKSNNGRCESGLRHVASTVHPHITPLRDRDQDWSSWTQIERWAVRAWRRGKTTIIITHDVSQFGNNDYVYVMDRGRVIREGTRDGISKGLDGRFASLITCSDEAGGQQRANENVCGNAPSSCSFNSIVDQTTNAMLHQSRSGEGRRISLGVSLGAALLSTDIWAQSKDRQNTGFRTEEPAFQHISQGGLQSNQVPEPPVSSGRTSLEAIQAAGRFVQSTRQNKPTRRRWQVGGHVEERVNTCKREEKRTMNEPPYLVTKSTWAVIQTVWPNLASENRIRLVMGLVFCYVAGRCAPASSFCFAQLLTVFWATGDRFTAGQEWAVFLILVAVLSGVSLFLGRYFMEHVGQVWANTLRLEGMKRTLQQQRPWFHEPDNSARHIVETLDRHAEEMRNLVLRFVPIFLMIIVIVTISTVWALLISWKLTLVALSRFPVVVAALPALSVVDTKWEAVCNRGAAETASITQEALINIRVTRAFTLEKYFCTQHAQSAKSTYGLGLQSGLLLRPLFGFSQSIDFFVVALICWYGMYLVAHELEMSAINLQQVANLLLFCVGQTAALIGMIPRVSASQAAATRVLFLATFTDQNVLPTGGSRRPTSLFPVKMRNVTFAYPSQLTHQVLRNVNLCIGNGKCVAMVGPSGCGKSTIISLLLRLYGQIWLGPTGGTKSGQLTFGGIASDQINKEQFCSHISYVPQAPFLFPATIAENIAYGLPETSPWRQSTKLDKGCPKGGNPRVHHIPFARLRYARRRRWPESLRRRVTTNLIRRTIIDMLASAEDREMSVVVATHCREMMRIAQRIVVLEAGRVVGEGTFHELQSHNMAFSALVNQEFIHHMRRGSDDIRPMYDLLPDVMLHRSDMMLSAIQAREVPHSARAIDLSFRRVPSAQRGQWGRAMQPTG